MASYRSVPCHCPGGSLRLPEEPGRAIWHRRLSAGRGIGTLVVGLGIALLPKCPMCLAASLGFIGAMGLNATVGLGWVRPFLVACLIAGVGVTGVGAGRRHAYGPCLIGACALVAILVGELMVTNPILVHSGLAALAVALFWDRWPLRSGSTSC